MIPCKAPVDLHHVLAAQKLPADAIDFLYVVMGRQIYPHTERERWQVVLEIMGGRGTGTGVVCSALESFHRDHGGHGRPLSRTGRLPNTINAAVGISQVLGGEKEEKRAFAVVHPDLRLAFCTRFPLNTFRSWARNAAATYGVKDSRCPVFVAPPHTAVFTNNGGGLHYDGDDGEAEAASRHRLTVRFTVPCHAGDATGDSAAVPATRLALMMRCACAYWETTAAHPGVGIWTKPEDGGFLPAYFFEMRELNRTAGQALLTFLREHSSGTLKFGERS